MSEISNYEAQKKKLQGLCDEHNFTFRFFKDRYPITLVITPINDVATQMDMLGNVEETGYCSQDSSMCWYFENSELKTKVKGTFSIDKVLRTKIENILLKMISFWQQFFFRDLMENGKLRNFGVPVPDVPDSNSQRDSQQDTKQETPQDDEQALRDGTHKIFREYGPDEKKWSDCDYCKAAHPNCDKCCKTCDEPCNAVQDCKKNEERTENDE